MILHGGHLTNREKGKFYKLANDLNSDINLVEITFGKNFSEGKDRLSFPKIILPHFVNNKLYNEDELTVFMMSPHIFNNDIFAMLKENNLVDKKGVLPCFERKNSVDFGENTDIAFLNYLSKTPFFDGDMLIRIIRNFLSHNDEKIHLVRALYNVMLRVKHKIFFSTEERYTNYINEHLYNKETDKIIHIDKGSVNLEELLKVMEKGTLLILFTKAYYQFQQMLERLGKVEGVDYVDGRVILTDSEGGFLGANLNLLFRDV
ncbi:MAG: hypothetical protein J6O04_06535 [Selenomonadaceae bacterium]|nr:hypothetical protein [Selenomonadaceae bacterium]